MKQGLLTEEEIRLEYGGWSIWLEYDEESERKLSGIRAVKDGIHVLFTKEGDRFRKIGVFDMTEINGRHTGKHDSAL